MSAEDIIRLLTAAGALATAVSIAYARIAAARGKSNAAAIDSLRANVDGLLAALLAERAKSIPADEPLELGDVELDHARMVEQAAAPARADDPDLDTRAIPRLVPRKPAS